MIYDIVETDIWLVYIVIQYNVLKNSNRIAKCKFRLSDDILPERLHIDGLA